MSSGDANITQHATSWIKFEDILYSSRSESATNEPRRGNDDSSAPRSGSRNGMRIFKFHVNISRRAWKLVSVKRDRFLIDNFPNVPRTNPGLRLVTSFREPVGPGLVPRSAPTERPDSRKFVFARLPIADLFLSRRGAIGNSLPSPPPSRLRFPVPQFRSPFAAYLNVHRLRTRAAPRGRVRLLRDRAERRLGEDPEVRAV